MSTSGLLQKSNAENDAQNEILRTAQRCRSLFQSLQDAYELDAKLMSRISHLERVKTGSKKLQLTFDDLIDEFEQFRVWTRNLGVFAPDQASLDYRLREAEDVKSGIASLLKSLGDDLDALFFLLHRDRDIEDGENSDSATSGDSSSDEFDLQDATERSAYELGARLARIPDTINKMMQIAAIIRASNPSARGTRSANYVHYEDGVNMTEQFENEYLPLVLELRYKLKDALRDRFKNAISLRRRRFLYQAKHQQRLAYSDDRDDIYLRSNVSAKPRRIIAGSLPPTQTTNLGLATSIKGSSQSNVLTVATAFRKPGQRKNAPSTIVSANSRTTAGDLEIPPPPPIAERATHFQCPYCCILLSKRKFLVGTGTFSKHLWNKHVLADLQPYVCLEDDCRTPNLQLETREDWLNHQKWEHSLEWWCEGDDANHDPKRFTTPSEYIEHAQEQHHRSYELASKHASTAGRPSLQPFNACPFCDFDASAAPSNKRQEGNAPSSKFTKSMERQTALQNHICDELVNVFLVALPERADIKDIDTETGRPAAQRSTVLALQDVSPDFEDDDDREQTLRGSDQFPLEFELSGDPFDVRIDGPEIHSWDEIWESPQLEEGIRATYAGFEHDPHLQGMLAAADKDEIDDIPFEKWIPTLTQVDDEDPEPLILVLGRRVPDDIPGFGISCKIDLEDYLGLETKGTNGDHLGFGIEEEDEG